MIPRQIYQTYSSHQLPAALADNVAQLRATNPQWGHTLFDDADIDAFILEHYGERMLASYHRIHPSYGANRADLFRYLLIYKLGGVYLDIKSATRRPLDEVLREDDAFVLSYWKNQPGEPFAGWGLHPSLQRYARGELQQWHIIAAPGHPFLKAVIDRVLRHMDWYHPVLHGYGKNAGIWITGPVPYTQAIHPLLGNHAHRLVDAPSDLGLDYSFLGASQTAHQTLFKGHYSKSAHAVVRLSWWMRAATPVLRGLQIGKGLMRRLVSGRAR